MNARTPTVVDSTLLSPTVAGVALGTAAPTAAAVTNAYWEDMTPASICDSFFAASEAVEPTAQDAAQSFWA